MDYQYNYQRYLDSKKQIDDLALNKRVLDTLSAKLDRKGSGSPIKIIEIGAGIGTMVERLLEANIIPSADYTAFDISRANVEEAKERIIRFAERSNYSLEIVAPYELIMTKGSFSLRLNLIDQDAAEFIESAKGIQDTDLVIAQAVLDLVNPAEILPNVFSILKQDGLLYSSINFDGITYFGPTIDDKFDSIIEDQYHKTMINSTTGRHLLSLLVDSEWEILAAGSSDWIIYPSNNGYDGNTSYFLHYIINTVYEALSNKSNIDQVRFESWINKRHEQVENNTLQYIAHQFDYLATRGPN